MKKLLCATLFIVMICQLGFAQDFDKAKLDHYFNALEENNKFMGGIAVSQNGEIIYQRNLGFADVERNIKADADSKYRIGSISKTFTAVLTLKAVEEGKLDTRANDRQIFPYNQKRG